MKHLLRPYKHFAFILIAGAGIAIAPPGARAQGSELSQMMEQPSPVLLSSNSQGYLGVWVDDVDKDKADTLKLKEVRGALITLIDHDAPAGKMGLKVNDVVVELNGQPVEGAEQLKRMLREIPPGRQVSLTVMRDGAPQTMATELADHKKMVEGFWTRIGNGTSELFSAGPSGNSLLPDGDVPPNGGHISIFGATLHVGAAVEPLSSQMAGDLGVRSGLMVRQVTNKSEAAAAGLKAWDVILKVGADSIATLSDWERSLRSNQGKQVQLTILRDKKQQILTLQVDSKRTKGELDFDGIFGDGDCPILAELNPDAAQVFAWESEDAARALSEQAGKQAEEWSEQAKGWADQFKSGDMKLFRVDPDAAQTLENQAEKLRESMKDFRIDPKQMDEFKHQMEQFRQDVQPGQLMRFDQKRMDEWKRQADELAARSFDHRV